MSTRQLRSRTKPVVPVELLPQKRKVDTQSNTNVKQRLPQDPSHNVPPVVELTNRGRAVPLDPLQKEDSQSNTNQVSRVRKGSMPLPSINIKDVKITPEIKQMAEQSQSQPSPEYLQKLKSIPTDTVVKQITKRPDPKARKVHNHYNISVPYSLIQIDILFLPEDKSGQKYCLTCIDAASRFKWAQPLSTKTATAVLTAFKKFKLPLEKVKVINTDKGSEFMGSFHEYLAEHNIQHVINDPGHHLAFVEAFNGTLARALFKKQFELEIETKETARDWVHLLQPTVDRLNNTVTQMIKKKPANAIKQDEVMQPENDFDAKQTRLKYPIGTVVRKLLKIDQIQDPATSKIEIKKRRATDPYWSLELYYVYWTTQCSDKKCLIQHWIIPIDKKADWENAEKHSYNYLQLQSVR